MTRIFRAFPIIAPAIILLSLLINGCTAPCNYPDQRGVIVRIINAMPDMPVITAFINGKAFVKNYAYDPLNSDLYLTTYLDGTPLNAGDSSLIVITSDGGGLDTVAKAKLMINFNRQTIIAMGRGHIKATMNPTSLIIRLDDQTEQPNSTQTLIRLVNAVPDLDSLDIYFKADASGSPDVTLHYGKVYPHLALTSTEGLTATEAGHPENVIFSFPKGLLLPGVYVTAIIRGESKPLGTDFTAAPLVISDIIPGVFIYAFKTFAIRSVNATRSTPLSLLIRSTYITLNGESTNPPRNNYPNQSKVLNISAGMIGDYMPLNINLDSVAGYWFSTTTDPKDSVVSSLDHARPNVRYSKIAVEETPFGSTATNISYLNLPDTMTNPVGNFGRVRIINLSPDHASVAITFAGKTVTMNKRDVLFFDVPSGPQNILLKDGANSNTRQINVSSTRPASIYLLPESSSTPTFPIAVSAD